MKFDYERFSNITINAGLVLLFALSSFFTIQWLRADTLLGPENDSKMYFVKTFEFVDSFSTMEWGRLGDSLQNLSHSGRPPLYQILSIPFLLILGRSMDSATMVNLVFQAGLIFFTFKLGKLASSAKTGFLAALLVSVYPPLVQLSRIYRPHFALAACVALTLWRLLSLYKQRSVKNVWYLVLAFIFGIFIHPTFLFTTLMPVLIGSIYIIFFMVVSRRPSNLGDFFVWLKNKLGDPIFLRGYLPALLFGIALALGWYSSSGVDLMNIFTTISVDNLGEFRGYEVFTKGLQLDGVSYFWWYLITMPNAISLIFTGLFAIGLVCIVWKHKPASLLLVGSFLGAYLIFANLTTMTWMHFSQVLPVVAIISATWAGEMKNKALIAVCWTVLLATSLFVYIYVTWGPMWMDQPALALGAQISSKGICQPYDQVFCPTPSRQENWRISEILKAIVNDPNCRPEHCDVLVLKAPGFNFTSDTFLYYKTIEFPETSLTMSRLEGGAFDIVPFNFEAFLQSPYIIYVNFKNPGSSYFGAATRLIQNPPGSFARSHLAMAEFSLPGGRKARLLKRTAPLTLVEAQEVIRAMDLEEKYKFGQYRVLAPLYAQAGQFDDAIQAYQRALDYEPMDPFLYFGLAGVYETLGQMDNASSAYRKVVVVAPGSDLALQAQAWLDANP